MSSISSDTLYGTYDELDQVVQFIEADGLSIDGEKPLCVGMVKIETSEGNTLAIKPGDSTKLEITYE